MTPQAMQPATYNPGFEGSTSATLDKEQIVNFIEDAGVIPALRVRSAEEALYVAESLAEAGLRVIEISAKAPEDLSIISHVASYLPKSIVGAGGITSPAMARRCIDAGARFLTSDALILDTVEFAANEKMPVVPGAFTPTEILAAWNAGADFVKVVPCDAAGGASYIRSIKAAFPDVRLIAAGGVTQQTALGLIAAGATALGVGRDLIPSEAVRLRQTARIQELARRFLNFVDNGRIEAAGRNSA